ncbi:MAG: ABC transporter permease [Pseudomonadota bacterium]|nr:ABC transporter permease [Pseudomonadota bacterium]HJO34900.1 ABC transporter permease [Gammaproteobacteria bacterium]
MNDSLLRIGALMLRYYYLIRGSWPRLLEQAYWPTVQMIIWGFITKFMAGQSGWVAQAAGVFIAAVLLWDTVFRSQLGVFLAFIEEVYARNLGQLFVSPLRPWEMIAGMIGISFFRTLFGVGVAALLAVPLFGYSILGLGLPLVALFGNLLVFGWAMGLLVAAMLLRYGLGAESIGWASIFALAPLSGIYYPIATLPDWLQPVAFALPTAHVFEGMRQIMFEQQLPVGHLLAAAALNVGYLALGAGVFLWVFRIARERGLLLQQGE